MSSWSALWSSEETHPFVLFRALVQKYGAEWVNWAPAVLRQSLHKSGATPARINLSKALATAAIVQRDEFWTNWEVFHFLAQALNNNTPSSRDMQELTVGQMMTAVDIAEHLRKELKTLSYVPSFSDEVARFVAAQAKAQAVWYLPAPLDFAAHLAAGKSYRCGDCGSESEVVFDDGLCDTCIERWSMDSLKDWAPNPALLQRGRGRNITIFEKNPTEKVKTRLAQALTSKITLLEKPTDVCVSRLLVAIQYAALRRRQRDEQLLMLKSVA